MNRVFKSIWNSATSTWVAVSELGQSQGKKNSACLSALNQRVSHEKTFFRFTSIKIATLAIFGLFAISAANASVLDTDGANPGSGTDSVVPFDLSNPVWSPSQQGDAPTHSWIQGDNIEFFYQPNPITLVIPTGVTIEAGGISLDTGSGDVTITGGSLSFGNSIYVFSYGGNLEIQSNIVNGGIFMNALNNSTMTFSGQNTYTDDTTILEGTLRLTGGSTIGNVNLLTGVARLETGSNTETIGLLTGAGSVALGGDLILNQNTDSLLEATTEGVGTLIKNGTGVMTVSVAPNINHTGGTVVNGVAGVGGIRIINDRNDGTSHVIGDITLNGGNIIYDTTNDDISTGDSITGVGRIVKEGPSTLVIEGGVNISNNLDGALGHTYTSNAGFAHINNSTFSTSGNNASAIYTEAQSNDLNFTTYENNTISTSGDNSHGVEMVGRAGNSDNRNDFTNNVITTTGNGSSGVKAIAEANAGYVYTDVYLSDIATSGVGSHGIDLQGIGDGAYIDGYVNSDTVLTTGANSDALRLSTNNHLNSTIDIYGEGSSFIATGADSNGVRLSGDGTKFVGVNNTIMGAANGLLIEEGANSEITDSQITSSANQVAGNNPYAGIKVVGQNTNNSATSELKLTNTHVDTTGDYTPGLSVEVNAEAVLVDSFINTAGFNSHGIVIENTSPATTGVATPSVHASNVNIATTGEQSVGVYSKNGGYIFIQNSTIETGVMGDNTKGVGSHAIRVDNAEINVFNPTITTHGNNALGALATSGSVASIVSGAITTYGDNSFGVAAISNQDPTGLYLYGVNISTSGAGAGLVLAEGTQSTITVEGGSAVQTSGSMAHGFTATDGGRINFQSAGIDMNMGDATSAALVANNSGVIDVSQTVFTNSGSNPLVAIAEGNNSAIIFKNNSGGIEQTVANNNGRIEFNQDTSVANTMLTSSNGGTTALVGNVATDSTTTVFMTNNGNLDLVGATTPLNIGTLSGSGQVLIGDQILSIGSSNFNTVLSGNIITGISSLPIVGGVVAGGTTSNDGGLRKVGTGTLTLAGNKNIYFGDTVVAAGTLRSSTAGNLSYYSKHIVNAGATLDIGNASQTLNDLTNAGTVSLVGVSPGTDLVIHGSYVGQNGVLRLGATLGDNNSLKDRLVLDGPTATATGYTDIQLVNQGGLGMLTSGNGIEVIAARNGATTTAQSTKDAFGLVGGVVNAGAYEYRLKPGATDESWYLSSHVDIVAPPPPPAPPSPPATPPAVDPGTPIVDPVNPLPETPAVPTPPPAPAPTSTPTYRAEVPMIAALPSQVHQTNLTMLASMRTRQGDNGIRKVAPAPVVKANSGDTVAVELAAATQVAERQVWGRAITADMLLVQDGMVGPRSDGSVSGFQSGTDIWVSPDASWKTGAYFGQLNGRQDIRGFSSGIANNMSGHTDLKAKFFGAYATYNKDGFYLDNVLQYSRYDNTIRTMSGNSASSKAHGFLASIEVGNAYPISQNWSVEPQAQLIVEKNSFDDIQLGATNVKTDNSTLVTGRVGVRLKGDIYTEHGLVQPYGRLSVYKSNNGDSTNTYGTTAANTQISTPMGSTYSEVAVGAVWNIQPNVAIYGEVSQFNRLGSSSTTRSATQGSVGVKISW